MPLAGVRRETKCAVVVGRGDFVVQPVCLQILQSLRVVPMCGHREQGYLRRLGIFFFTGWQAWLRIRQERVTSVESGENKEVEQSV